MEVKNPSTSSLERFNEEHPELRITRGEAPLQGRGLVFKLSGSLDSFNAVAFSELIRSFLDEARGAGGLHLDLSELSYISSSGIGALASLEIDTRESGPKMRLFRISASIRRIFDVLGFSTLFSFADDQSGLP